jgi:hypothetical protein
MTLTISFFIKNYKKDKKSLAYLLIISYIPYSNYPYYYASFNFAIPRSSPKLLIKTQGQEI